MSRVAVVTDSSANLAPEVVAARDITVIDLQLVIDGLPRTAGELASADVAAALRRKSSVLTSRPNPHAFLAAYEKLAAAGASEIVSVHLSAAVSGTYDSAVAAAAEAPLPVVVVDSRTVELALGFAVVAGADAAASGAPRAAVAEAARRRASRTRSLFYVDTLEYLRRGGRVSAVRALLGSALSVKPLLHVRDGQIEVLEKVRTATKARTRLEDLAVEAAGDGPLDLAVEHLDAADDADALAGRLADRIPGVADLVVREVGPAVGAHVGPGMLAVIVAPRLSAIGYVPRHDG